MSINLKKLEKIALLAFKNARRLHGDAIVLYKEGRYPSAFYLSILSQEEIGKMHIINDFVWESEINGAPPEFEEKWLETIYKHPIKQGSFLRNSPLYDFSFPRGVNLMDKVYKGMLESKKQNSIYVGLERHNGKIDFKGKIRDPHRVNQKTARDQITKISDYFLVAGVGIRYGCYSFDNEEIERIIKSKRFIKDIYSDWKEVTIKAKKMIKDIQLLLKEKIISV